MLKKKLPFEADDVDRLVRWITAAGTTGGSQHYHLITKYSHPVAGVVKAVENLNAQDLLPENSKVHQGACDLLECLRGLENATNMRKSIERLEAAVGAAPESPVLPGEAWSDKALADLEASKENKRAAWNALLSHCFGASQGKPTQKWIKTAKPLMKACLLYTSPSPRDLSTSRMPSSA